MMDFLLNMMDCQAKESAAAAESTANENKKTDEKERVERVILSLTMMNSVFKKR